MPSPLLINGHELKTYTEDPCWMCEDNSDPIAMPCQICNGVGFLQYLYCSLCGVCAPSEAGFRETRCAMPRHDVNRLLPVVREGVRRENPTPCRRSL